ncbi:expressed unknown protein [Seminavis robusta]|uniref:Uncharacterized protein n=1 Tax=Seminavis robusta TaxID=568900 RepID=A0A9N8DP54_9STRA|nr:expressed unknown protein [Seminavis robusta]|eukprot:Sro163_g073230.1 n/a (189) ;mRNA; r:53520-54086
MMPIVNSILFVLGLVLTTSSVSNRCFVSGFGGSTARSRQRLDPRRGSCFQRHVLSSDYLENDLLAIASNSEDEDSKPRLCVVKPDGTVYPLCQREDDVETDMFVDPREYSNEFWGEVTDEQVTGSYGEGWYGQRPVPSLGGGPGYGAEADEIWSIDEELIETIRNDGVDLPILDMGIAHGEKARAGAF